MLVVFDALKIAAIRYGTGDEFIYFHMGKLVADGKLPYRDFLFTHPPLQLIPPAFVFATIGFHFTALKLISVLVANVTAFLFFDFARRAVSPFVGVLAAALFLFSTTGHTFASAYMGQETTVALIAAGLVALQRRRPVWSGVWLGLATMCGLYAACAVVVVLVALARTDRTALRRFLVGCGVTAALGATACFAVGGAAFWEQVVVFQSRKVADPVNEKWPMIAEMALFDPAILALACVVPRRSGLGLPTAIGCAYVAAILAFANVHLNYAELFIPFFAVAAAGGLVGLTERFRVPRVPPTVLAGASAALLCVIGVVRSRAVSARSEQFPLVEVAREVEALTEPGATVFGEASVTPLVALLAKRGIVEDCVDTTGMNYLTGTADLRRVMGRMGPDWPGVVVLRNTYVPEGPTWGTNIVSGPMMDRDFAAFLSAHFMAVRSFPRFDKPQESILLYVRSERAPLFERVK
jgi:hypothetical protein